MLINLNKNILDSQEQYIIHQCNCITIRSANLAKTIFDRFPYANSYINRKAKDMPGTIKISGDGLNQRFVINLYGQFNPGGAKDNTFDSHANRLKWFRQGLHEISKIKNLTSVAFPERIGCGAAKGNWMNYLDLLTKFEKYVNTQFGTEVYIYSINKIDENKRLL